MLGLVRLTFALSRVLPARFLYGIYRGVGYALYYARPRMRRDLLQKISDAMPEVTESRELARIGRGVCASTILPVVDGVLYTRFWDRFMRGIRVEGRENLERAEAMGEGLLVMTPHLSATVAPLHAIMARWDMPYTIIAWHPDTLPVPRYANKMSELMQNLGCDPELPVIFAGPGYDVIGPVRERLAKNRRVGMTIDVPGKCIVPLFGRPAALADGIAHFSYDSGAPILPMSMHRTARLFERRLVIQEPITSPASGDRKKDIQAMMEQVWAAGERQIRQAPEEWMSWFGMWHWWELAKELMEERAADGPESQKRDS
jgi:lauroyl/myristoyl acyltransferase